jgi:hypothetical protein
LRFTISLPCAGVIPSLEFLYLPSLSAFLTTSVGFHDDVVDDSSPFLCHVVGSCFSWSGFFVSSTTFGFLSPFFLSRLLFAYIAFEGGDPQEKANLSFFPAKWK